MPAFDSASDAAAANFQLTQTPPEPTVKPWKISRNGTPRPAKRRLPEWFKVRAPGGENYTDLKKRFRGSALHTVCEEAACPNIGDCWERRTATFMILGDTCTRACSYCNVKTGWPGEINVDWAEPFRLAQTVNAMDLKYTVVTSVDRDDLPDFGSSIFAMTITQIHRLAPECKVEVLIPDFGGDLNALRRVVKAEPEVLNHNIEAPRRIFSKVRPKGDYDISLELIRRVKEIDSDMPTKSGMMVGLGETKDEVYQTMQDLRDVDCDLLTIGQYLRPSDRHHPLIRFYHPSEFNEFARIGMEMGFKHVASGPLVRSSYHADEQHESAIDALLAKR